MKNQSFKIRLLALLVMLLATLGAVNSNAQQASGPEIKFSTKSYKQVLAAAKSGQKMIFIDAFATWCAPCKELRKTTFKDPRAAEYFNKNFVSYSVDVEKGEGIDLAKKWQVEGLPTLLILDKNGKVLASHTGYVDGKGLMEFAGEVSGK
ncbi:thioredoxin family protein [Pedobacter sp. 22163]|uniref:thioredoxin family protein n=1 Tax=Pedobacter sp. 22163 TaxID=3453883 RepID=UPI003F8677DB